MKSNTKRSFAQSGTKVMLAAALIFGMAAASNVWAQAGGKGKKGASGTKLVEKTIIITGFSGSGITPVKGDLIHPDWDNWLNIANGRLERGLNYDGETATLWLWTEGKDGERWTGTGEYSLILSVTPARKAGKKSSTYTSKENVVIKDAETTLKWSDFEYGWEND